MSPLSVEPTPAPAAPDEISILDLLAPFMRRWKVVLLVPLAFSVVAIILWFLLPPGYTAVTTFTEEGETPPALSGSLAGLVGLAGQFGLNGGIGGNLSPSFLASVLQSRELLDSTVTTRFSDPRHPGEQRTLLDIMDIRGKTPRERLSNGVRTLSHAAEASVDQSTGIITLNVKLRDPNLAAAVANRMVQLLDQFNTTQRQTQSRLERVFVAGRLAQAEKELQTAEQQQVDFLKSNRSYTNSPLLIVQANRLDRQVQTKQETFLTLTKAYEDARIAEVRNTPSITIIDSAVPPIRRSSPHLGLMVVLALFTGTIVSGTAAYLLEFRRSSRRATLAESQYADNGWGRARRESAAPSASDPGR